VVSHTREGGLKTAFLGLAGLAIGAACGCLLGAATADLGEMDLGIGIFALIGGFWAGGLACGFLGVWWGRKMHGSP
jgi:hypothetical protein